ncbi:unnamed protein product [Rhizoctonia solani]|uniref:Uncharacterized protein n=1 Tax=Rhizoctonia solani TaxID=456999 RepID=A0A8H3GV92_9AGAM|nr:unnamed protein product [Rhizoctonia solani]
MLGNGTPSEPIVNNIHPTTIDNIASNHGLSGDQRMDLHRFVKTEQLIQNAVLYAHTLSHDKTLERIEKSIEDVRGSVDNVSHNVSDSWTVTKEQKEWIEKNPASIEIPEYSTSRIVQSRVVAEARQQSNDVKSRLRKMLEDSIKSKTPLSVFVDEILRKYRLGYMPGTPLTHEQKALFANYRDVAARIIQKRSESVASPSRNGTDPQGRQPRADSGFWGIVDEEHAQRVKEYGEDSEKWEQWASDMIEQDERRYGIQESTSAMLAATVPHMEEPRLFAGI